MRFPAGFCSGMVRLKKLACITVLLLACSGVFAQTGGDPIASIASALRQEQFDEALKLIHVALVKSPGNSQL